MDVQKRSVRIALKAGGKVILEGSLEDEVRTDDAVWTVDDGVLVLTMTKNQRDRGWWKTVIKGDPVGGTGDSRRLLCTAMMYS